MPNDALTDLQYESEKGRVDKRVDFWLERTGLMRAFTLYTNYHRSPWQGDQGGAQFQRAADTDAQWEYRHAKVTFYLQATYEMDSIDLDKLILHELAHILLGPLDRYVGAEEQDRLEFVVESFARAMFAIYAADTATVAEAY